MNDANATVDGGIDLAYSVDALSKTSNQEHPISPTSLSATLMKFVLMPRLYVVAFLFGSCYFGAPAMAQMDRVYTIGGDSASAGTVTEVTKNGLRLKAGQNIKDYTENEIRKVIYQGDPRELTRGREFAIDGQYQQALDEMKGMSLDSISRDLVLADAEFYLVLCQSKLALAGQGDRNAAVTAARNFARKHSNSYHFFDVAKLLGDLAVASKAYDQAIKYYGALSTAPSTESKIESRYLTGVALLEKGDTANAEKAFGDVAGVSVQTTEALRLKTLAQAGQAVVMARTNKGKQGLELIDTLIAELNPADIEMASQIYNAQGACFEATSDIEGAIMAYLHTHLMFSGQPDAHAKALSRLVKLWPQVGRNERANEARQELQQRYPGYAN